MRNRFSRKRSSKLDEAENANANTKAQRATVPTATVVDENATVPTATVVEAETVAEKPSFELNFARDPARIYLKPLEHDPKIDRARLYAYTREEKLVMCCFAYVFGGFVTLCVSAALAGVFIWLTIPTAVCPAWNSRICNNQGICASNGTCLCYPAYSGVQCQETLIPAYDSVSGQVCNGRGIGALTMQPADVPTVCQKSWYAPACRAWVQGLQAAYDAANGDVVQILATPNLQGLPTCFCIDTDNVYDGTACERATCPANQAGQICAGNGNQSVSLFSNHSVGATGCYCTQSFSLADPVIF